MTGRRPQDNRVNIAAINKSGLKGPVKKEIEFSFGMIPRNPAHQFVGIPSNALHMVLQKEAGIDGDLQTAELGLEFKGSN